MKGLGTHCSSLLLGAIFLITIFGMCECYGEKELQSENGQNGDAPSYFLTYGDTPIKDCDGSSKLHTTRVSYSDDDGHQVRHLHVKEFH
ncbi:hypothetical protein Ocin01_18934 [Orchesella cincta]|uniref:Transmembrane protein n=1 Tax=Orchesella cincta TaxID=48709 RepID=A0A1D2M444_ORCCI|nr:hypothetical protein Ocin01_18934 [Orchesella cincta]